MADEDLLYILKLSVEEFNNIRKHDQKYKTENIIDLRQANLWGENLQGANLKNADLQGAVMMDANLLNANLKGANLWNANLHNATVFSLDDLRVAENISEEQLESVFIYHDENKIIYETSENIQKNSTSTEKLIIYRQAKDTTTNIDALLYNLAEVEKFLDEKYHNKPPETEDIFAFIKDVRTGLNDLNPEITALKEEVARLTLENDLLRQEKLIQGAELDKLKTAYEELEEKNTKLKAKLEKDHNLNNLAIRFGGLGGGFGGLAVPLIMLINLLLNIK